MMTPELRETVFRSNDPREGLVFVRLVGRAWPSASTGQGYLY